MIFKLKNFMSFSSRDVKLEGQALSLQRKKRRVGRGRQKPYGASNRIVRRAPENIFMADDKTTES